VWFDLGSPQPIGSIEWLFAPNSYPGFADGMQIQISNDKQSWTAIASPGGAPPGDWQSLPAGVNAQFVRFYFENPGKARQLGFIAEVKFLP
jgi:F5/8 type C domain